MRGQGGEKPVPVAASGSLIAWATDAFSALNLTWKDAPAKQGQRRVLGTTTDQSAIVDLTVKGSAIVAASAVVPIKAEYTPLLTFLLAVLVEKATRSEADAWLARQLNKLRRDRPSVVAAPWHQWRVVLTTNQLGLLTVQVK